eukprot:TRINITY_DN7266_c0_g1_i12.p1 TRINITY_DN7266_c0_g1~~TRINITY_DN7266_c0_g1_i12.p1  ORF type:complete len:482 (-),score=47.15 TRINITY_DN7266_c0_g1_i12:417-1796(-)
MQVTKLQQILFIWSFLSQQISGIRFGSLPGVDYIFNHTEGYQWCNPSFECDIISYLCWEVNNENPCQLTILESLEERLTALENDQVDIVVSQFNVSPERGERVDFVRPYYYGAGAQLFTLPKDQQAYSDLNDLTPFPVCMDTGYYVAQTLAEQFGLIVFPSTKESMFDQVSQGFCVAAITDSTFYIEGLVPASVDSLYKVPYAVAVSKSPKIPNLASQVQKTLLKMLLKENDGNSFLEDLENKYLVLNGVKQLAELGTLSDAITPNNGSYIGEDCEDVIWKAANLTSTRNYADELQIIDPVYDEKCREGLTDIYNAITNGVPIADVPIKQFDEFSYVFLADITTILSETEDDEFVLLRHPILEAGVTYEEFGQDDPNQAVRTKIDKEGFLNNQADGTFYYITYPLERTYTSSEFSGSTEQFSSTSRTMLTTLRLSIVGKGVYQGRRFVGMCPVGEISDW